MMRHIGNLALFVVATTGLAAEKAQGPEDCYYREGPLRGSLKSDKPLPLYDSDPEHLWNRLFVVFCIRPSELLSRPEYSKDSTKLDEWDRKLRAGKLPRGPVVNRFPPRQFSPMRRCQRTGIIVGSGISSKAAPVTRYPHPIRHRAGRHLGCRATPLWYTTNCRSWPRNQRKRSVAKRFKSRLWCMKPI